MQHTLVKSLLGTAVLTLLCGTAAQSAEATSSSAQENAARARVAAAAQKARALLEAERSRPRIAGIWQAVAPATTLHAEAGKLPPLNAAGRKAQRARGADPMDQCLPPGTPRILSMATPFLVTQSPAKVMVFHQTRHLVRHIWLDGPLKLEDPDPTWEGISSGGWQGDTLVIETASFNGRQWLDAAGLPQSPAMKVTERWHLADANTLDVRVTIDDPAYYVKPWTTQARFKRLPDSTELPEEECSEKLLEFPLKPYAPE
jgi:hypothetical protein